MHHAISEDYIVVFHTNQPISGQLAIVCLYEAGATAEGLVEEYVPKYQVSLVARAP